MASSRGVVLGVVDSSTVVLNLGLVRVASSVVCMAVVVAAMEASNRDVNYVAYFVILLLRVILMSLVLKLT